MLSEPRTILVYNPVSGHGHLDSWNAMFVALLLERGWRVAALTPDAGALRSRLEQKGLLHDARLHILDWNAHQSRLRSIARKLWHRWDRFGDRYFYRRPGSEATADLPLGEYWKRRVCLAVVPSVFQASHFAYARLRGPRGRPAQDQGAVVDPDLHLACPIDMARRARAAVKKARLKPDLAFNMYMDTYKTGPSPWSGFAEVNGLPWAGIRFVPPAMPQEAWYRSELWRGMCLLDESLCRVYDSALPGKCFGYLPDVTETAMPDVPGELVREIRRRARGRSVVFLGGSIGGQKNLARWFELIGLADAGRWFFVQVGEIHRGTLTSEDVAALDRMRDAPPENLLLHAEYLPDERAFNEIIAACDVIFAVYRDFRISSNMLGKAAHFRKPILVSDRYLLGERVASYGIGRGVDEDSAASILHGLSSLAADPVPAEAFTSYCAHFSLPALAGRLDDFLQNCATAQPA